MSRWLSLARHPEEIRKPLPDTSTKPDRREVEDAGRDFCPVVSGCRVDSSGKFGADGSDVITVPSSAPKVNGPVKPARPDAPDSGGYHRTWTGGVVNLAEWRNLSEWDRHGPDQRMHCGICKLWVTPEAPCLERGCWKGGAA